MINEILLRFRLTTPVIIFSKRFPLPAHLWEVSNSHIFHTVHTNETIYGWDNMRTKQHANEKNNMRMRQHHHVGTTAYCLTNVKVDMLSYIQGCVQYALNEVCALRNSIVFFFRLVLLCENVRKPLIYKSQVNWFIKISIIRQRLEMYKVICFMRIKWHDIHARQRLHSYD